MAGLKKIDYFMTTHFDRDHSGGVAALAKSFPLNISLDHGEKIETNPPQPPSGMGRLP